MRVVLLARDLIIASRVAEAAAHAGVDFLRFDGPGSLPPAVSVDLLLVDWSERGPEWGNQIRALCEARRVGGPKVILFGPHTDLAAHAAAREASLAPMWARSKILTALQTLFSDEAPSPRPPVVSD